MCIEAWDVITHTITLITICVIVIQAVYIQFIMDMIVPRIVQWYHNYFLDLAVLYEVNDQVSHMHRQCPD